MKQRKFFQSLTFKNLGIFLIIMMISLLPLVASYIETGKRSRMDHLAGQLELVARQSAMMIDADTLWILADPSMTNSAQHENLVKILARIQSDYSVDNAIVMRRQPDGSFIYLADGNNQFYVSQPVDLHTKFPETFLAAAEAWENKGAIRTNLFGLGIYDYLQVYSPLVSKGEVVGQVLINKFAEDVDQAIRADVMQVMTLSAGLILLGVVIFGFVSSKMLKPLTNLNKAALRIAAGDLDVQIKSAKGRDEVTELNNSFSSMVHELRENRESLYQKNQQLTRALARVQMMEDLERNLSKFVPREVGNVLRRDPHALEKGKVEQDVSVLFLDVEGSTQLTKSDPQSVDTLIQDYFSKFLDCIYENNGDITETAGDGLVIIFQGDNNRHHALGAVNTAVTIQKISRAIADTDRSQKSIRINMGISSGLSLVGFTKFEAVSGTRITFTATGMTTIMAARLEQKATGGSILISQETMSRIEDMPEFVDMGNHVQVLSNVALKNMDDLVQVYKIETMSGSQQQQLGV